MKSKIDKLEEKMEDIEEKLFDLQLFTFTIGAIFLLLIVGTALDGRG